MRIIQERYTNSEFACHTAKGDASTPDEVLHLAAEMQFAGFNGVIGTLWKVDDAVAHQVVIRFLFKPPNIDFEHAAAALNTVVIETADEVSLEKRIVFVHIFYFDHCRLFFLLRRQVFRCYPHHHLLQ